MGRTEAVAVLMPVTVMLAIGLWGLDRGGMWRDEAVTFQVARRSVPQIWQLLHSVDAVHGLYYLLMHVVLAPHPGEVALRLPSVCGAAATAGLVAALGVRLCRPRVGLWAGLLYAVTPMTGHFAQEGRSYALVAAGVAAATLLLVRAARTGGWWAYGGTVAVTCLLHEFAVLVLLAHATTLALARVPRRMWWGWGCAAGAAVLVLLPLALVSKGQSAQVAWLPVPGVGSADRLLLAFAGPRQLVLVPYLVLVALALRLPLARRGELALRAVALPLMVVPPAVLMTVSRFWPLYDERYVLYALAGAPLLAAAGAERLVAMVPRLAIGGLTGVLAIALAFVWQFPLLRQDRTPDRRPDNLAAVSAVAGRELRPGDPVLFLPSLVRRSALAYPNGFRGVRDIALREPGPMSGTLYGQETDPGELRRRLDRLDRVWVVAEPFALRPAWYPGSATERLKLAVVGEEFVPREEVARKGVTLRLYVRRSAPGGGDAPVYAHRGAP
ncbi:glycosyltransferase family 39 protein [Streptomyces sp. NBC_00038]|uniref:glycosyltransferase family 39 protein n=1 Tax=Streptomyces sp. NBC_00038 TaxID=2903615 RepID=UPI002B1CEAD0|nr:glycosyltransferase family 39 protein [Streptomyces sp. NBC_00038]